MSARRDPPSPLVPSAARTPARQRVTLRRPIPSIDDRVSAAKRALTTIVAVAYAQIGDLPVELDRADVAEVIYQLALEAHDELYWVLLNVEGPALDVAAPDDDDRAASKAGLL